MTNKKNLFYSFLIIIFVFAVVHSAFLFHRNAIAIFNTPTERSETIQKNPNFFSNSNYVNIYKNNNYINYTDKQIFYSKNNYCLIDITRPANVTLYYTGVEPRQNKSFINTLVCQEFYGDSIYEFFSEANKVDTAFDAHTTITGYHTSLILIFIFFCVMLIYAKYKTSHTLQQISKYGLILLFTLALLIGIFSYLINTFSLYL